MISRIPTAIVVTCLLTAGCVHHKVVPAPIVHGMVTYSPAVALPPDAILKLDLVEVTRADAPDFQLVSQSIPVSGQPPISFELPYSYNMIHPRHKYELQSRIVSSGQILYVNTTPLPLFTGNAPSDNILVQMRPVRAGQ
jgi:uncharacterized lipoprotein YbaY